MCFHCHKKLRLIVFTLLPFLATSNGQDRACAQVHKELPRGVTDRLQAGSLALENIACTWERSRTSDLELTAMFRRIAFPIERAGKAFLRPEQAKLLFSPGRLRLRFDFEVPVPRPEYLEKLMGQFSAVPKDSVRDIGSAAPITSGALTEAGIEAIAKYQPGAVEFSWDGHDIYSGSPPVGEETGSLVILPISKETSRGFPIWRSDYFLEIGFRLSRSDRELQARIPIRSEVLALLKSGALRDVRREVYDGADCLVVSIVNGMKTSVFYLDEASGYSIRRREELDNNGNRIRLATMADFIELDTAPPVFVPRSVKVEQHKYDLTNCPSPPSQMPIYTDSYRLISIVTAALTQSDFAVNYESAGALIGDSRSTNGQRFITYTVPANLAELDEAIAHAVSGEPFVPSRPRDKMKSALITTNVAVVAILILLYWRKRRLSHVNE